MSSAASANCSRIAAGRLQFVTSSVREGAIDFVRANYSPEAVAAAAAHELRNND
jgi:hypothetical protein